MKLKPIGLRDARGLVALWHRHLPPPQGGKFAISAWEGDRCVGVAIVGRPIARHADDGVTAEVVRVATDGSRNACSFLLSRAKRAAQALGFVRVTTMTLPSETGASLRAVGARQNGLSSCQNWRRHGRTSKNRVVTPKQRWLL